MTHRRSHHEDDDEDDDVLEWVDQVMATVAAEVRRRRKERRMSAQDLADACARIGHPIPRNVIANMESGRRATLPLVDVIVLAAALQTNPICLIYPVGYVADVQRLPLQDTRPALDVLRWFAAEDYGGVFEDNAMLRYHREHRVAADLLDRALVSEAYARRTAETAQDPAERARALRVQVSHADAAAKAMHRLKVARSFITRDGGVLPSLPLSLLTDDLLNDPILPHLRPLDSDELDDLEENDA